MAVKSITLTMTSYNDGVDNFTIYHTSIDPNNVIATGVSAATMAAGFCTEQIYSTYVVKSNTASCQNSYYISVGPTPTPGAAPTSTPGATETPTPTPTPTPSDCFTYSIQNNDLVDSLTYRYIDCNDNVVEDLVLLADTDTPDFCARSGSVERQGGTNSYVITEESQECTVPQIPTATPTPDPDATPTPTAGDRCFLYTLFAQNATTTFTYTDCITGASKEVTVSLGEETEVCARDQVAGTITMSPSNGGTVTKGNPCGDIGPTPTPIPPLGVFQFGISSVSINSNSFTNQITGSVYASTTPDDWATTSSRFYVDEDLTTTFNGGNNYFHITSETHNVVWSVSPTGLITTEGATCGTISKFYRTVAAQSFEDPCTFYPGEEVFTVDFDDIADMQDGDTIYANSTLTTQIADNVQGGYALANSAGGANVRSFTYSVNSGVANISICPTPTPAPTATPTATPFVSYQLELTSGSTNNTECFEPVGAFVVYSDQPDPNTIVGFESTLYTDSNLTTPFDGDDLWYGIAASGSVSASRSVFVNRNTGLVSVNYDCGTPVPTPTPTLPIYRLYRNAGNTDSSTRCFGKTSTAVYTQNAASASLITEGAIFYDDAAINNPVSRLLWYGISDTDGGDPVVKVFYSGSQTIVEDGEVTEIQDCSGSLLSVSMSSYHLNFTDACNDTTPEFIAYYAPDVDPYDLQPGEQLFADVELSTPFGNNNLYYGVYSGSQASPTKAYQFFTGSAKASQSCAIPTATPTPTPSPTPFVFYSMSISSGSTESDNCTNALTSSVYASQPLVDSSGSNIQLFTDEDLTIPFEGGNLNYRVQMSGSAGKYSGYDGSYTVTNTGVASNYDECGVLFTLYGTTCRLTSEDPCDFPITRTLYTNDFTTVDDIEAGDKIYVNATLTTELADNCRVAISDTYENTGGSSRSGLYTLSGGWSFLSSSCPAPTPTPTPTSTPTPTPTIYEFGATEILSFLDVCGETTTGSLYTQDFATLSTISVGDRLYRDAALTEEVTPGGDYIGLSVETGSGHYPSQYVRYNNTTGIVSDGACPTPTPTPGPTPTPSPTPSSTPTPTPTATPSVFTNYFTSTGYSFASSACLNTCTVAVYTAEALGIGSTVYTDSSLTTPLAGGFLFWGYGIQDDFSQYGLEINNNGVVIDATSC